MSPLFADELNVGQPKQQLELLTSWSLAVGVPGYYSNRVQNKAGPFGSVYLL